MEDYNKKILHNHSRVKSMIASRMLSGCSDTKSFPESHSNEHLLDGRSGAIFSSDHSDEHVSDDRNNKNYSDGQSDISLSDGRSEASFSSSSTHQHSSDGRNDICSLVGRSETNLPDNRTDQQSLDIRSKKRLIGGRSDASFSSSSTDQCSSNGSSNICLSDDRMIDQCLSDGVSDTTFSGGYMDQRSSGAHNNLCMLDCRTSNSSSHTDRQRSSVGCSDGHFMDGRGVEHFSGHCIEANHSGLIDTHYPGIHANEHVSNDDRTETHLFDGRMDASCTEKHTKPHFWWSY